MPMPMPMPMPLRTSEHKHGVTRRPSNNHLGLSLPLPEIQRVHHHRDTPIYSEPGAPLPGRAYYTDNRACYNCSLLSASDYDKTCCTFHDDDHPKRSLATEKHDDEFASQSNTVGGNNISRVSYFSNVTDIPRSSCLSFQCSGELFPKEGEWLSSSLPDSPKPSPIGRSSGGRPLEHHVESWLSDTSELYVGCDILARATILSPGRAQVIEVNRSDLHLSGTTIPPRVSSLSPPPSYPGDGDSWASCSDSSPDTPCGEWEFDDNRFSRQQQPRDPPRISPRGRHHDLAMASPPMSPIVTLDPPAAAAAASRFSIVGAGTGRHVIDAPLASRWSLQSAATAPKSDLEIISELEAAVSGFASTMLGLDTPCIATIRVHLAHSRSPRASQQATECQQVKNFSRPRRPVQLTTSRSSPMMSTDTMRRESIQSSTAPIGPTSDWRSCSLFGSLPPAQSPTPPPTPDLEALHRIFPDSASFVRRALYAHILAYTFLASFPDPPAASSPPGWRRRGSPYWSNSRKLSAQHTSKFASDSTMQLRAASLKAGLRKSIFRLMTIMGSGAGGVDVLLRAVVEVVRTSEVQAFASTRNVI
ncbi:uncharacterized protein L3040_005891 [Drepanopeziza brunnea f. sp. 'multigermtubi']|uniref:uncharacterized protein n=1 Tax=Drepanopeziza brunnea f. sp. 'multigermtubi' TaxID=698441 RepID=UPI0023A41CA3|nr:hypothetical protein L3040_005891 [Drepanopeziza brunnea f. sp. 'multigermtubi']